MNNVFKKNLVFFILIIASLAVVSGCGRKEETHPLPLSRGEQSAEKSAVEKNSEVGETHPLPLSRGELATSSSEIAETATSTDEIATSNKETKIGYEVIEPKKTDCADEMDMSCWRSLINSDYGFLIKYPNGWYLEQKQNYILIKNTKDELVIGGIRPMDMSGQTLEGIGIEVEFFKDKLELSLKNWIDEKLLGSKLSYTNVYIDGLEGKRVEPLDSVIYADPNIFIKNKKDVYNIRFLTTNENQYEENIKTFDKILTTIKIKK